MGVTIVLIIVSIIFLSCSVFFGIKMQQIEEFRMKPAVIYLIAASLLITITSFITLLNFNATSIYLLILATSIVLGVLNSLLIYKFFAWANRDSFLPEMFFSVLTVMLGSIGFIIVSNFLLPTNPMLLQTTGVFSYLLPFLFQKTYQFDLLVPSREYKKWRFPEEIKVLEKDLHEHLLINLVVSKRIDSSHNSIFTIRAPLHQELGDVFCYFINGYNRRQEINNEIRELKKDADDRSLGWLFYTKSRISGRKNYIDPNKSIKLNGIKEKQIVYTNRVYL